MASDLIFQKQTMSSLEIAELAERNHRDVMRSIREMEPAWEKVSGRKFALAEYADAQGKQRPCYELTKTECLYVATKFNDEARAKLVKRWEELETKEQSQPVSLSPSELILKLAQINVENERKMKALEEKQTILESEIEEIKQRTTTDLHQSTIVAYVSRNHIKLDVNRYGAMGRKASTLCKKRNIAVTKINDVRWGKVNVFPDEILDEVFGLNGGFPI